MEIPLSTVQRDALRHAHGGPITLVDRVFQEKYVLLGDDDYQRLITALIDSGISPVDVVGHMAGL